MDSPLTIQRLVRVNPPVYEGTFAGKPLQIRLDSSAVMKLEGTSSFEKLRELLDPPPPSLVSAAFRLIQLRHVEPASEAIVVTVSALDLS